MCKPLRSCYCHFYLPKHETDHLPWWVPTREPKREVLPQPLTLLRLHICDQEPRDYLITITTSLTVWGLLISPTGISPALPLLRVKRGLVQAVTAVRSSQYKKHYEMKHEIFKWKCFVQTHLHGALQWPLNIIWCWCTPMSLATRHHFI